jgi:hypothetical protein
MRIRALLPLLANIAVNWLSGVLLVVAVAGLTVVSLRLGGPVEAQQFANTVYCNQSVVYDTNTNGSTTLVASSSGTGGSTYICGYTISAATAVNVKLVFGTKVTNPCDTGTKSITPAYNFQAVTTSAVPSITDSSSNYRGLSVPAGNDLCINTSAGNSVQAIVYYYQQH